MDRTDIIKYLISTYNHKSYLEIGTEHPQNNFDKIVIDKKHSVDHWPIG